MPPAEPDRHLTVIDETIREGMQFRGVVFSKIQRKTILEFQERLGIDICQAGYPPAHDSEMSGVASLARMALENGYHISVAAMGRASAGDIPVLLETGVTTFHLHAHLPPRAGADAQAGFFNTVESAVRLIRKPVPDARISIAVLDLGKSDPETTGRVTDRLISTLDPDMISLPDTSGMMLPNEIFDRISSLVHTRPGAGARISIHCHNDLGLACANSVMGVLAGARTVELSVLGIGERNGIADLYTTLSVLEKQGFRTRVRLNDRDTFTAYYRFVNDIVTAQTGESLINYTTPFFGDGVSTHVAGTHAGPEYGIAGEADFRLNVLCGKGLVKKYLARHGLLSDDARLDRITRAVKDRSAQYGRPLDKTEIIDILSWVS